MLDTLVPHFRTILVVGVLVMIVVGRIHRVAGSILSLVFWSFVAALGSQIYASGGSVGFGVWAIPQVAFYALCAAMIALYLVALRVGLSAQRRARERERISPEE